MNRNDIRWTVFWFVYALLFVHIINQSPPTFIGTLVATAFPVLPAWMARTAAWELCRGK